MVTVRRQIRGKVNFDDSQYPVRGLTETDSADTVHI